TLFAMRETFDEQNAKGLASFVASTNWPAQARAQALTVLAELHHQRPEWTGKWWATQPAKDPPPAKTVAWSGTPFVITSVTNTLRDPQQQVRHAAVEALAKMADTNVAPALCEMYSREAGEMKHAILQALGGLPSPASGDLVAGILAEPEQNKD